MGSPSAALRHLRQAATVEPQSVDAHYYLGHALLVNGDLAAAKDQLDKTRELDNAHQMVWHDLGLVFLEWKQWRHAEACFRESLERHAYHGTTLSNLGLVLLQQGKIPQGISMLERALQVRPNDQKLLELLNQARAVEQNLP